LLDLSAGSALGLEQRSVRRVRIYAHLGRPQAPNSPIDVDGRPDE
jgi:hypothetical protein